MSRITKQKIFGAVPGKDLEIRFVMRDDPALPVDDPAEYTFAGEIRTSSGSDALGEFSFEVDEDGETVIATLDHSYTLYLKDKSVIYSIWRKDHNDALDRVIFGTINFTSDATDVELEFTAATAHEGGNQHAH